MTHFTIFRIKYRGKHSPCIYLPRPPYINSFPILAIPTNTLACTHSIRQKGVHFAERHAYHVKNAHNALFKCINLTCLAS